MGEGFHCGYVEPENLARNDSGRPSCGFTPQFLAPNQTTAPREPAVSAGLTRSTAPRQSWKNVWSVGKLYRTECIELPPSGCHSTAKTKASRQNKTSTGSRDASKYRLAEPLCHRIWDMLD